jgi:Raf kinase inhibitor-like YbhB/YbcL family protein
MAFTLTSSGFADGDDIPASFTCDGDGQAPPLAWHDAPSGTRSYTLIFHDPDSTKSPDFTHWVLFDVPGGQSHGAAGAGDTIGTPGLNDFGNRGYGGPCPAVGRHRYVFDLYALDVPALGLDTGASRTVVEAAMEGHALARARLTAHYQRLTTTCSC